MRGEVGGTGGAEGEETIIRIYYLKNKSIFNKRKNTTKQTNKNLFVFKMLSATCVLRMNLIDGVLNIREG